MMIIGVDYHPSFQTIAFLIEETGECGEQELKHSDGEAERFYRDLQKRGIRVHVGMEATGENLPMKTEHAGQLRIVSDLNEPLPPYPEGARAGAVDKIGPLCALGNSR